MSRIGAGLEQLRAAVTLDAIGVVVLVAATDLVFFFGDAGTGLELVLGPLFVLFLPGYAVVTALFPQHGVQWTETEDDSAPEGVDGIERLLLSVGLSVVVAPLFALALNFTPVGLDPVAVVATLSAFTVAVTGIGAWRRALVAPERRFTLPAGRWTGSARQVLGGGGHPRTTVTVIIVVALMIVAGSVTWAALARPPGESFTEFYLLSENASNDLVMNDYPRQLTVDETASVHVGVTNHEARTMAYSIVVSLERVRTSNGSSTVLERRALTRVRTPELTPGRGWQRSVAITPRIAGEDLRLTFSLYRGDAPENLASTQPYQRTYLWVNISEHGAPRTTPS
ncbi:DUF1616 domain-containing protein [Halosimplex halobium]|uniref:DUF1616 domain-containing protein n=1 Tax=Halosimplex halobium TaxID=3396618 RepID=UPI003F56AC86